MNTDCIFCQIAAGSLSAEIIYRSDNVLAFMDIGPIVKGHTLVIPRLHVTSIHDIPGCLLQDVMLVARQIARAQTTGLGAAGVNLTQANGAAAGQVVPHFHVHVIPRFVDDGHHWNWQAKAYENPAEMTMFAARIQQAMA